MLFYKMHHLGNDFILLFKDVSKEYIKKICHRNKGIGADGVIVLNKNKMYFYNNDGSRANICGNALLCLGKYFNKDCVIETSAGLKEIMVNKDIISVNMNKPKIVKRIDDTTFLVDVGNLHIVKICDNVFDFDLKSYALELQKSTRANVNIIGDIKDKTFNIRTFELGALETFSCGSGLTASFYCLYKLNLIGKQGISNNNFSVEINDLDEVIIKGFANIICKGEIIDG